MSMKSCAICAKRWLHEEENAMPAIGKSARVCETCGSPIDETNSGDLGCMVCLLDAGLAAEGEPIDGAIASAPDDLGVYAIEHHADGSAWELGHGAMGVTYRAIDKLLNRAVALKIINANLGSRSAEARERFMREARAAGALRHPNVATVYQFGIREETGQFFYVMELVEGETLEERVRRTGPLGVRTTIDIAQQVTAALIAAEKCGLIHRDLKPANLMLVENGDSAQRRGYNNENLIVKIIDFGLAKVLNAPADPTRLTHHGFIGTPAFASPEQFENSALDVRSDIYSLGATLWFALTGKTPFGGQNAEEIRCAQKSNTLPIEQLKAAHVPHGLRSLLSWMLSVEPAARPGTHELAARLRRCAPQAVAMGRARVAIAAAAIVILAASAFFPRLRDSLRTENSVSNPAVAEKSIAVLPFGNLSPDPNNAFFTDGVQDEILTDLARIADLKVISRASVVHYKSGMPRKLREIGQQLGVAYVVEGSVQRADNRVRVNAQLVDARTDRHLWAQTYDRDLNDVFAIQSEIARAIADQLQAKLSPSERSAIERPPTSDLSAFDLYTHAKNLLLATSFSSTLKADLIQAAELLNQAVARDPSFFDAYCQLAWAHGLFYVFGLDRTPGRLASAEAAVQAASTLRANAGETHLARAQNLYQGYLDYDDALGEVNVARQSLPNNPRVFELTGYINRRQGRWKESTRDIERAIELDPRNLFTLQQLAISYGCLRRYAEAKSILDRVLTVAPDDPVARAVRATAEMHSTADTRLLHQIIDSIRATNPAAIPKIADYWLHCALAERDAASARDALIAFGNNPISPTLNIRFSRPVMEGVIARMTKDDGKARAAFSVARAEQEKIVLAQPNHGPTLCVLGLIDAGLGRKEEALREGRRAVELLPVEKDAFDGPAVIEFFAIIAAWVGDKDLACGQLAATLRNPGHLNYGELKLLPYWDPLRGDPRFENIVEEAKRPLALE
jgi:serine/threonine protein kinase/tetratricopeptide (TPR) repeat protein